MQESPACPSLHHHQAVQDQGGCGRPVAGTWLCPALACPAAAGSALPAPSPRHQAWRPSQGRSLWASPVARQGATCRVVWGWGWPPSGWGLRALLLVLLCSEDNSGALAMATQHTQRQQLATQRRDTAAPLLPPGTPGPCKLHQNSHPWRRGL